MRVEFLPQQSNNDVRVLFTIPLMDCIGEPTSTSPAHVLQTLYRIALKDEPGAPELARPKLLGEVRALALDLSKWKDAESITFGRMMRAVLAADAILEAHR